MITKQYFGVRAYLSHEHIMKPIMVEDEHGHAQHVETLQIKHLDAFTTCYTIMLDGREMKLYHELDSGAWYMLRRKMAR